MTPIPIIRARHTLAFAPPGADPIPISHIIGVGRNYAGHAREMGVADLPDHPLLFSKNPASAILDAEPIVIPTICQDPPQTDFEGELAVVIGAPTRDASESDVADPDSRIILGYTAANDVSARWWQKKGSGGQFNRGKSFDTFCPIGPALIPPRAIADAGGGGGGPQSLTVTTTLNDDQMQHASTDDMIFTVHALIAEISQGTTLLPGTVILTGTPSGVGFARSPQRFLTQGDSVTVTIATADGNPLATLTNPVTHG